MHRAGYAVLLLACILLPTSQPIGRVAGQAEPPALYYGTLEYRMRGPAAAPYGIGSAFLIGAAAPVAVARLQNILRNIVEIAARVPGLQDEPTLATVRAWMDEGLPIDLAEELPVSGAYEATITFLLEATSDEAFQLRQGTVRWRTSNTLHFADSDISLDDSFHGSGTYVLDPATDRISLEIDNTTTPPTAFLEMEIQHPEPLDGMSTFRGPEGTFEMSLTADGGEMVLDGSALGMPISAAGMPAPVTIVEAPGMNREVSYSRQAPLDEIGYHVEIWTDVFDNQVLVEYDLQTECQARITMPDTDAALTYDDSEIGVLEFTAEARAQAVGLNAMLEDLQWTFPEIPGSTLTTDPEDGQGRRVTVRYEGLPPKNNDFGEKLIEARFEDADLCGPPEPQPMRIFFSRDAQNNPEGDEPNWFYYWHQTRATQGHGAAIVYDDAEKTDYGYYLGFTRPAEADRVYIGDLRANAFEMVNTLTGKYSAGIDVYATVVLHEWTHLENKHDWWPDGLDPDRDLDSDWVPDDREAAYGLDPESRDTFGLGMRDCEVPAYLQEHIWPNGSADSVDWAYPGAQSGEGD